MKRTTIAVLVLILLLSLTACFVRVITLREKQFDSLDALQATAGEDLLYPIQIPPSGFVPTYIGISGYDDHTSWNYRIVLRDDAYLMNDPKNPDWAWRYAPATVPAAGSPATSYIIIYAFVPKDQFIRNGRSTQWPNMWEEIDAYERYWRHDEDTWEIDGTEVRYYCRFSATPEKEDDSGGLVPAYSSVWAYAGFMRDGLLYMVETRVYGHFNEIEESMCEKGIGIIRAVMTEMLYSKQEASGS